MFRFAQHDRSTIPALAAAFRMGVRRAVAEPFVLVGQLAIFWALIVSYGALLRVVAPEDLARLHITPIQLVWYMVVTETAVSFSSFYFVELQEEIRSGAIEVMLLRPKSLWQMRLAEWLGQDLVRLSVIAPFCFALGFWLSGAWIWRPITLLAVAATLLGAGIIQLSGQFVLGCLGVWAGDSRPFFWLWQKFFFLLGSLLWPLMFYPVWMQGIAWVTPFAAALSVPGNLTFGEGAGVVIRQMAYQALWIGLMLGLCALMLRGLRRRLAGAGI